MRPTELVVAAVWAAFWLYWILAAFSIKKGRVPWSRELGIRAVLFVVVITLVRAGVLRDHVLTTNGWRTGSGLALLALGLAFAVWAPVHIGRNWGTPMTQKNE